MDGLFDVLLVALLLPTIFSVITSAQDVCEDDFLLFLGQMGESEQVQLFKAPLSASGDIDTFEEVMPGPLSRAAHFDYNSITDDVYWTDYRIFGDIAIATINKTKLNSTSGEHVVDRNFAIPESPSLIMNGSSYYLIGEDNMTYADAENYCVALGGHLTSIHSYDENDFLQGKAVEINQDIWIGLDDFQTTANDDYAWIDGTGRLFDIEYTNWDSSDPASPSTDCCVMDADNGDGDWEDTSCSNTRGYICKHAKGQDENCLAGWDEFGGNCYYITSSRLSWYDARDDCAENRSSTLPTISSVEENSFLAGRGRMVNAYNEEYWIGYNDIEVETQWYWVDGTNQGRFKWKWPNSRFPPNTVYDCVTLRQDGSWYDRNCNTEYPFVCKLNKGFDGPLRVSPCEEKIYWEVGDIIYLSNLDGTHSATAVTGMTNIVDFKINAAEQTAIVGHYDSVADTSYLSFVDMKDGSTEDEIEISDARLTSLDVDWVERKIYFATSNPLKLQYVDFDGLAFFDIVNEVPEYGHTRYSVNLYGNYLYFIFYDDETRVTLRRVLKDPPNIDPAQNSEDILFAGKTFQGIFDLYLISCAEQPSVSFKEPSYIVEECPGGNTVIEVERARTNDIQTDPNLDCPTINFSITPETAEQDDYVIKKRNVTFNLNENSQEILINIVCDEMVGEGDKTFILETTPSSPSQTTSQTTITIRDFASYYQFKESNYDVLEGTGQVAVSIMRQGYRSIPGSIFVTSSGADALPSEDFEYTWKKVDFFEGDSEKIVKIQIINDDKLESPETFELQLHSPEPFDRTSVQVIERATVNITDDDSYISLGATHFSVLENTGNFKLPIIRNGYIDGDEDVTVPVTVYENQKSANNGIDFRLLDSTVTFSQRDDIKYAVISIIDDTIGETNEAFRVVISDPTGGISPGITEAHVAIVDDDVSYHFASDVYDVDEGNELLPVTVTREGQINFEESVVVAVNAGSATAGEDYNDRGNIELHFQSGDTSKSLFVDILDDDEDEEIETLSLILTTSGGDEIGRTTVNIIDNDRTQQDDEQVFSFETPSPVVSENDGFIRLRVLRSRIDTEGHVTYSTETGTAKDGVDFIGIAEESLEFKPGQESVITSQIKIINDASVEGDENFFGRLSQPSEGVVSLENAIITIKDDDKQEDIPDAGDENVNISSVVLAAIIFGVAIVVISIVALSVCGCVMILRPKSPFIIQQPQAPAFVPHPTYY